MITINEIRLIVEGLADVLRVHTDEPLEVAEALRDVASDGGMTGVAALMELVARFIEKEG